MKPGRTDPGMVRCCRFRPCFTRSGAAVFDHDLHNSIEDYIECLVDLFAPKEETVGPTESPFDLPASIDYLDAIWYRRFKRPLVRPPGVERSSRFVLAPISPADFDSSRLH